MEPIYRTQFTPMSNDCDCFGRLKPSALLGIMQEAAGDHCLDLQVTYEDLAPRGLFWAITRQHIQITRLPKYRETITIETWPGTTSRVAYPRSTIGYDADGNELFRAMSLWVLMDIHSRSLVVPGKSGIALTGIVRGNELPVPGALAARTLNAQTLRSVAFTELDRNGHMNNSRYLDWMMDLLPGEFHAEHPVKDFTVSYLSEVREADAVELHYELTGDGTFCVEATRADQEDVHKHHRVFAIRASFA